MNRAEKRRQQKLEKKAAKSKRDYSPTQTVGDQQSQDIVNLLNLGIETQNKNQFADAEKIYRKALVADPSQPIALHLLGVVKHQLGNNSEARELISKALAFKPDYLEAHNSLGLVFVGLNRLDEAITCYQKALEIDPSFFEAHNNLGLAFQKKQKHKEAFACYQKAIAINPVYSNAYYNLGNMLWEQGGEHLEEAVVNYNKAVSINENFFEAHGNLGIAIRDQGKLDEAAASFRKALIINANYAEAHSNLGSVLKELGEHKKAIACHRKAIEIQPNFAEAHYNLHALLLDPKNLGPSINCLQKALEYNPENTTYKFMLGVLFEYSGNFGEAKSLFRHVQDGDKLDRAKLDAWRYIKASNKKLPTIFGSSPQGFRLGLDAAKVEGLVLEFGVRFGTSIRQIANFVDQKVHGFDSFEGLPEAWHHEPKGSYTTKGTIPTVQKNVTLHIGLFDDTLPAFKDNFSSPIRFMNIDCDLYSSTKTVLDQLSDQIVPGTVIVFDEYIGNEQWREDEFKAFQEAVKDYGWSYKYLGFSFMSKQAVVQIL